MLEIIHPAKMVNVILDEIGLGRNWFFTYSSFTLKQDQNTKSDQIKPYVTLKCGMFNL